MFRLRHLDRGLLAILLCFAVLVPLWMPRLYAVDSVQYFAYLPSLLFDHDLDFRNEYTAFQQRNPKAGIESLLEKRNPTTNRIPNVAPIGTAILWSPAFLLAHGVTVLWAALGAPVVADGLSEPYLWAVCAASTLYGLAGLLLSYAIARRWAGVWPSAAAVIACLLATPVVFYTYVSPPWSHAPALFATALFIWYWLRVRPNPSWRQWTLLGVLGGLMVLSREQLGLWLLLPALDAIANYVRALQGRRWQVVRQLVVHHAWFVAVVALMLVPQLLVYYPLNGRFGPSTDVQGKLRWYSPHFFDTLLHPEHGAFLWTPLWLLGLLGLFLLWRRERLLGLLLLLALAAQVYINGSLDTTWHLTASFGFRRLIEATPVWVVGVAVLIDRLRWPRPLVAVLLSCLIMWNFGLIAQWSLPPRTIRDGLVWQGMAQRQLLVPQAMFSRLSTLLFEPCRLVENGGCS